MQNRADRRVSIRGLCSTLSCWTLQRQGYWVAGSLTRWQQLAAASASFEFELDRRRAKSDTLWEAGATAVGRASRRARRSGWGSGSAGSPPPQRAARAFAEQRAAAPPETLAPAASATAPEMCAELPKTDHKHKADAEAEETLCSGALCYRWRCRARSRWRRRASRAARRPAAERSASQSKAVDEVERSWGRWGLRGGLRPPRGAWGPRGNAARDRSRDSDCARSCSRSRGRSPARSTLGTGSGRRHPLPAGWAEELQRWEPQLKLCDRSFATSLWSKCRRQRAAYTRSWLEWLQNATSWWWLRVSASLYRNSCEGSTPAAAATREVRRPVCRSR